MARAFSFANINYRTSWLFRLSILSILLFALACVSGQNADDLTVPSDILLPVHDFLYIGDNLPKCDNTEAGMIAYRSDRTLMICTGGGSDQGWVKLVVKD